MNILNNLINFFRKDEVNVSLRDISMFELYKQGKTLDFVAKKYNLSRERIRQIFSQKFKDEYFKVKDRGHFKFVSRIKIICPNCGKEKTILETSHIKFCSKKCFLEFNKRNRSVLKEKRCTKCGEIKPIKEFFIKDKNNYLYYPHCKKCHRLLTISWNKRNPEIKKLIDRKAAIKYILKNRDRINFKNRERWKNDVEYWERMKRKSVEYQKRRYKTDPIFREKNKMRRRNRYWSFKQNKTKFL